MIYTYRIENTGTVTLTSISAKDNKLGAVAGISTTLLPGEFTIGTPTHVITTSDFRGPLVNTVVVTGTGAGGLVVTNTQRAPTGLITDDRVSPQFFLRWATVVSARLAAPPYR